MGCKIHYSLILTGHNYKRLTRFNLTNVNIIALEPQWRDGSATLEARQTRPWIKISTAVSIEQRYFPSCFVQLRLHLVVLPSEGHIKTHVLAWLSETQMNCEWICTLKTQRYSFNMKNHGISDILRSECGSIRTLSPNASWAPAPLSILA